jgi:indolepyruvate ferredoxin oxidoreductase beta subunit
MNEFNIVLAGVGGQGTLLAGEIIGSAALRDGLNVRVSEIHGMAQRGGAVVSNVRMGERVLASTVLEGQADVLLGFEPLETIRNLKYASERTLVVMSEERVPPAELALRDIKYPSMKEVMDKIKTFTQNVILVEATRLAEEAGSSLAQNSVLIGALAGTGRLPVKTETLIHVLKELVPRKHMDTNAKAFRLGYDSVKKACKEV